MSVEHVNITDPNIHEPKGVATASIGKVYVANGAGGGTWKKITESEVNSGTAGSGQLLTADGLGGVRFINTPHGEISFINITVPYTLTYPSAYAKVAATTVAGGSPSDFTEATTSRITYTGTISQHFQVIATLSVSQATGATRDLSFMVYKNGVAVTASEVITTSVSGNKAQVTIHADIALTTNDYIEIYAKNHGASGDILVHTFYLFAKGLHQE